MKPTIHWPTVSVVGIFITCGAACLIVLVTNHDESTLAKVQMVGTLATLAALAVSFIDRQQRSQNTDRKIDENTLATKEVPAIVVEAVKNGITDTIAKKTAEKATEAIKSQIVQAAAEIKKNGHSSS